MVGRVFNGQFRNVVIAGCVIAAVAVSGGAYFYMRGEDPHKLSAEAKRNFAKGDLKTAEAQLKAVLQRLPDNADARLDLGLVLMGQGDLPGAEAAFTTVLRRTGNAARVMPLLGEVLLREGKSQDLLNTVNAQDMPSATAALVHALRARAYLAQRKGAEAEKELDEVLAVNADLPNVLLVRAEIALQRDDAAGAEALIDRALAGAPNDFHILDVKADLRRRQGDVAGAEQFYAKAIEQNPGDVTGQLGLAAMLLSEKKPAEAQSHVDVALQRVPGHPVGLYLKAAILSLGEKYQEAFDVLQSAGERINGIFPAQLLLMELNLRLNHTEQALELGEHLNALRPDSVVVHRLLAAAYASKGNFDKVIPLLERIAAASPNDPAAKAALGDAYARDGRLDAARKTFGEASRLNPSDSQVRLRYDALRLNSDEREAATNDLSALVAADPNAQSAGMLLIATDIQNGKVAEAAKLAEDMKGKQPDSPLPDYLLGMTHQAQNDRDAARKDFQASLAKSATFYPAAGALASLHVTEGRPAEARSVLDAVLKADPKQASAMVAIAGLDVGAGKLDEAESWLEQAIAAQPKARDPRTFLLNLLLSRKKAEKALTVANAFATDFPDDPAALQALGNAQFAAGQEANGVASFRRVAELQSSSPVAQYEIGRLLLRYNRPSEARQAFEAAIKLDAGHFQAWRELVRIDATTGGIDGALVTAQRAAALNPKTPIGDMLKAAAYVDAKRFAEADASFAAALQISASPEILLNRAQVRLVAGDIPGSHKLMSDWLGTHPQDDRVRLAYATSLLAQKDYSGALREYEDVLKRAPNNVLVLNNLAWLHDRNHDHRALDYARKAVALAPRSPDVADTLGWLLFKNGDLKESEALLTSAHAAAPNSPAIAYHLGALLAKQGSKEEAVKLVRTVVEGDQAFDEKEDAKGLLRSLGG